jgi:hypothetical protein
MIFISHAREDREVAAKLMNELEAEGFDCQIDPDLIEGDPFWRETIARQFLECELMLCLMSSCAERSPWVDQEQRAFPGRKMWIAVGSHENGQKMENGESMDVVPNDHALSAVCAAVSAKHCLRRPRRCHPDPLVRLGRRQRYIQRQQTRLDDFLMSCSNRPAPTLDVASDVALSRRGSIEIELKSTQTGIDGRRTFVGTKSVTNAQYRAFIEASGYEPPKTWRRAEFRVGNAPVTGVNWFEACAFAAWAGGSLPTEDDWIQCACGNTELRRFATANGEIDPLVAYYDQPFGCCAPLAQTTYPPNPEGFYGLCGNSWDWCASPWGQNRVIRGGGYMDAAAFCKIESHYRNAPIDPDCSVGFRVKVQLPRTH